MFSHFLEKCSHISRKIFPTFPGKISHISWTHVAGCALSRPANYYSPLRARLEFFLSSALLLTILPPLGIMQGPPSIPQFIPAVMFMRAFRGAPKRARNASFSRTAVRLICCRNSLSPSQVGGRSLSFYFLSQEAYIIGRKIIYPKERCVLTTVILLLVN